MEYRKIFDCPYEDYERLKAPHRKKALCSPLSTHPSHGPTKRISLRNPPTKNFCKKNKTGNPLGNAKPQLRILTQKINSRICGNGTTSRNFFPAADTQGTRHSDTWSERGIVINAREFRLDPDEKTKQGNVCL